MVDTSCKESQFDNKDHSGEELPPKKRSNIYGNDEIVVKKQGL